MKTNGTLGIAGAGLSQEISSKIPEHLLPWWTHEMTCLHSANWWKNHWEKTGIIQVQESDSINDGWKFWVDWQKFASPNNQLEIDTLTKDSGEYLGYVRTVGVKKENLSLEDPLISIPENYTKKDLQ
ncbi:MAG: hypothetical protein SFU98_16055 [Leptospiraceae bacterium]|nr:hypothetical protein [Leptospiraceae bacterium]